MDLAFLLDLHLPLFQNDAVLNDVVILSYLPVLKLLKSTKNVRFSLCVTLSDLEVLENKGHKAVLDLIKELLEYEKLEIVGGAAYRSFLPSLSKESLEKQILLNEYALGYYFGRKTGFEGDPSVLIKDIIGFCSYEMLLDEGIIETLDDLGYVWTTIADSAILDLESFHKGSGVFLYKDYCIKILPFNASISKLICDNRDSSYNHILSAFQKLNQEHVLIYIPLETLGYLNRDGVYFFDTLLDKLLSLGINIDSVSSIAHYATKIGRMDSINATSFSGKDYLSNNNTLISLCKNLVEHLQKFRTPSIFNTQSIEGYETLPIWKSSALDTIKDADLKHFITLETEEAKALGGDLILASTGDNKEYIKKFIHLLRDNYLKHLSSEDTESIKPLILKIESLLS